MYHYNKHAIIRVGSIYPSNQPTMDTQVLEYVGALSIYIKSCMQEIHLNKFNKLLHELLHGLYQTAI